MPGEIESIVLNLAKDYNDYTREYLTEAALSPGDLVERTATGTVQKHSTAQGSALKLFALEDKATAGVIGVDYEAGVAASVYSARPGDRIKARVNGGTAAILAGALLASDGAGGMITATGAAANAKIIGQALEAVDNSGGGSSVFIQIEVA